MKNSSLKRTEVLYEGDSFADLGALARGMGASLDASQMRRNWQTPLWHSLHSLLAQVGDLGCRTGLLGWIG